MANWQRKIELGDVFTQAGTGELPLHQLAGIVADRIEALAPIPAVEDDRQELIQSFRNMADDDLLESDEFDWHMERLYDWGDMQLNPGDSFWDMKRVCWINTFSGVVP